jgi:hypothetical protein
MRATQPARIGLLSGSEKWFAYPKAYATKGVFQVFDLYM